MERGKFRKGQAVHLMQSPQLAIPFQVLLDKNAQRQGRGRRLLPQGDEVVEG